MRTCPTAVVSTFVIGTQRLDMCGHGIKWHLVRPAFGAGKQSVAVVNKRSSKLCHVGLQLDRISHKELVVCEQIQRSMIEEVMLHSSDSV